MRSISANGGSGALQMVSESDTGLYVNDEAIPQRGYTRDGVQVRTLVPKGSGFGGGPTLIGERKDCRRGRWVPKGGWIVTSHIGWGG